MVDEIEDAGRWLPNGGTHPPQALVRGVRILFSGRFRTAQLSQGRRDAPRCKVHCMATALPPGTSRTDRSEANAPQISQFARVHATHVSNADGVAGRRGQRSLVTLPGSC